MPLQLLQTCEKLGAGEILLNCIDKDCTNSVFDIELIKHVSVAVSIPVIASSGAGKVEHFSEEFGRLMWRLPWQLDSSTGMRCPLRQ